MTLSDLAAIGNLVSGVAVLISLVYLSLQVRQTERNQRAIMNQGAITRVADILIALAQPSFVAVRARVQAGETDFSAEEITQLSLSLRVSLLNLQDVMVQHRSGLIDQITFDNSIGALKAILGMPVQRALWLRSRASYAPEMAKFVDKLIAETPVSSPVDVVAQLKSDLAEMGR